MHVHIVLCSVPPLVKGNLRERDLNSRREQDLQEKWKRGEARIGEELGHGS